MVKTAFLQIMSITSIRNPTTDFSLTLAIGLRALQFYICKFEVNRDQSWSIAKCWSNLTLTCNDNTFAKADAQIEEECRRTTSYLQGYSCPRLFCKKLSNEKPTARNTRRTTLCWMRNKIKELPFIKLFICSSLLETNLNKAKYSISEKLSTVFSVAGLRLEEKQSHQLQYFLTSIFQLHWKPLYLV